MPFDDVDDAITRANDTDYGLGGSVWTSDQERGLHVAAQIQSGMSWVNQHAVMDPLKLPFGGMKHSGFGRIGGPNLLAHFAEPQVVSVNTSLFDSKTKDGDAKRAA